MIRTRHMYESKEELDAMREKANLCAGLMERVLDSPYPWTRVGFALMRYCFNAMVYGWTPCYPGTVMFLSNEKEPHKECVDLRGAFENFKSMHSIGNAAVLYRLLRAYWRNDEDWVVETQNAMEWFFGDLHEMAVSNKTENRWISVEYELPELYEPVLLLFPHNMAVGYLSVGYWSVASGGDFYTDVADDEEKPTHWMELPAPPSD